MIAILQKIGYSGLEVAEHSMEGKRKFTKVAKKLRADQRNYKKAFQRHSDSYEKYTKASKSSRYLLLCYCVECGLKCLVMKSNRLYKVENANEEIQKILGTHDIRALLNEVKQAGKYSFFHINTEYGDVVSIAQYHQMCRYGINSEEKDREKEKENIKTLENIMNWLKEEI